MCDDRQGIPLYSRMSVPLLAGRRLVVRLLAGRECGTVDSIKLWSGAIHAKSFQRVKELVA